jgi:hypothetical protein
MTNDEIDMRDFLHGYAKLAHSDRGTREFCWLHSYQVLT